MDVTGSVSVLYICWVPAGVEAVGAFVTSYAACLGGMPHDLNVLYRGYNSMEALTPFRALFRGIAHQERLLPDSGLDIGAYWDAARLVTAAYVCCLNTSTVLLDADWLRKLYAPVCRPDVGVAGATGSWEGPLWYPGGRADFRLWRQYAKKQLEARWANRGLVPFPNPHVRTNAFLMERERFLNLQHPVIRGKEDAHRFEHGKHSLTRQLHRQGLKTLLVGRDGQAYDVEAWPRSGTYCCGEQSNLLVADNRTRAYENADTQECAAMRRRAWGAAYA